MFILVRVSDNTIVGNANNPVNVHEASRQGRKVYEIDDEDFSPEMIGQKLSEYKVIE